MISMFFKKNIEGFFCVHLNILMNQNEIGLRE